MSQYAISILEENGVSYEYKNLTDYIINNAKTGMCPMENKYKDEKNIKRIYQEMLKLTWKGFYVKLNSEEQIINRKK